jgi:hypothetical protein
MSLPGHCPAGKTEKVNCRPQPEVPNNIDMTVGKLGLTDEEENQIVAFLQTLTDGFTRPYPNRDTFTGSCMKGGSAKTQGNEFLIPTPPLPPCASAICASRRFPALSLFRSATAKRRMRRGRWGTKNDHAWEPSAASMPFFHRPMPGDMN